jgi:hypothetical protein
MNWPHAPPFAERGRFMPQAFLRIHARFMARFHTTSIAKPPSEISAIHEPIPPVDFFVRIKLAGAG